MAESTRLSKILLLDCAGAILTFCLLVFVLPRFQSELGMPVRVLYFMALFPCLFVAYDLFSYFLFRSRWRQCLTGIAYANFMYCVVSAGMLVNHREQLTGLGWLYFVLEILVIGGIAKVELKVART